MLIVIRLLTFASALTLIFSGCASPRVGLKLTEPTSYIQNKVVSEASGIVKSKQYDNVFWIHNDSGDMPRIFAIDSTGQILSEVEILSARNVDWEDIAQDNQGNLYIGDIGNNTNLRKDLGIYVIQESKPGDDRKVEAFRFIPFRYPDQKKFGNPLNMNFDAEALFYFRDTLWLLTKHRSNSNTKLYRFSTLSGDKKEVLEKVDEFDVDGMVTGADICPDGTHLAVLTYDSIWIFQLPQHGDDLISGKTKQIPIFLKQCEGICWDGDELIVVNEEGELYRIDPNVRFP